MNREPPFYYLDDGTWPIPPLYYAMLNKSLALTLLEDWVGYLWVAGREERLIAPLNGGIGQGFAVWRVLPAPEEWQQVVRLGLASKELVF